MANIEKRQSPTGKTTYRVKVRLKGYPPQSATFERLTDARKWEQHTESTIREGRHFKTNIAKKHTLNQLLDRYISDVMQKKTQSSKFIQNQTHQLNWWKEKIGNYLLSDVTASLIVEYRDKLLIDKKASYSTSNRYLAALSHAFTKATKEWGWLEYNPVMKIERLKEPRGRVRFLSDSEREKLLKACKENSNPYLYMVVVLALSTGARKMEIMNLKWSDLDFQRSVITLYETKNGEIRLLPLSGLALTLIQQHSKNRNPNAKFLFPSHNNKKPMDLHSPWTKALEEAEIEDFRFHDLRHSAASYLAMNGASLAEIAEVLGHKTLQMVKRYSHLSEAHTASVVEKMNNKIFG